MKRFLLGRVLFIAVLLCVSACEKPSDNQQPPAAGTHAPGEAQESQPKTPEDPIEKSWLYDRSKVSKDAARDYIKKWVAAGWDVIDESMWMENFVRVNFKHPYKDQAEVPEGDPMD